MEEEIRALEIIRVQAMLDGNIDGLHDILDEELVYTHSFGERDTKKSYLAKVKAGHFDYKSFETKIEKIVFTVDCAIVTGSYRGIAIVNGAERQLNNSSLIVWRKFNDTWQVLAFQPTVLPK